MCLATSSQLCEKHYTILFEEVLKTIDLEKKINVFPNIHSQMQRIDPGFDIKHTSFKKFLKLAEYYEQKGVIKLGKDTFGKPALIDIDFSKLQ